MRTGRTWISGLSLAVCLATGSVGASEMTFQSFQALDSAKQDDFSKSKAKKNGIYFTTKLGRYTVNAETSGTEAVRWALLLNNYTQEVLNEGIVPKTKLNPGDPTVYVLKDRDSYVKTVASLFNENAEWSDGMFIRRGNKAALLEFEYSPEEEKKFRENTGIEMGILQSTLLHEGTHQMVYYHIGSSVPVWFNEGIATNFETYELDMNMKANLYNAMYQNLRASHAAKLNQDGKLKSFPSLFLITRMQWKNAEGEEVGINYSSAWASCNYLFTTKKGRKFVGKLIDVMKKNNDKADGDMAIRSMLDSKDLDDINESIKTHAATVLLPVWKYGRTIRKLLNEGDKEKAAAALEEMKKEFPDSNEMKFYQAWLDILNEKAPADAVKMVDNLLKTTDFNHPEANYVMTLGYFKAGNAATARSMIGKALESNAIHKPTLDLKAQLK